MTVIADTAFVKKGKMTDKPFPKLRDRNGALQTFFNKVYDFDLITHSYAEDDLKPHLKNSIRLFQRKMMAEAAVKA